MPLDYDATMPILLAGLVVVLLACAGFLLLRKRAGNRETAARDLCAMLDGYLDSLIAQEAGRFDTERLWARLEQARIIHRMHFPELYAEMLELARVHGDLTSVLLEGHLRRHGAQAPGDPQQGQAQLEDLQQRAAAAVLHLKRRCRSLAYLYADSQRPG